MNKLFFKIKFEKLHKIHITVLTLLAFYNHINYGNYIKLITNILPYTDLDNKDINFEFKNTNQ